MIVVREIAKLRNEIRKQQIASGLDKKIGFVPTMGFLHEGHASLLRKARELADIVVLSIFVNPIQFGPNEDYERYPRDEERDLALAEREGVDIVFMPSVEEMYPQPIKTKVSVSADLTSQLCGASRPGHFDGVTTVVSKLFHIVDPDYAFFGLKDAQQVAVIQQMVQDLSMKVTIVPCPIVREQDGLALSSRNVYLEPEQRKQALVLSQSLQLAKQLIATNDNITIGELQEQVVRHIESAPLAVIDYVQILNFPELSLIHPSTPLSFVQNQIIIALAVKFGSTRLIDNVVLHGKDVVSHV
ncbi:pantoate--beta-alanine ligase [Paenibacillus sediminis]|uniref:Pantothenate synthetase n=1 Tax=Paenibacillus sediminis TaxID=664909 RepID=A0ABS4H103_9BACL|nr:pantoate--beta-alanine ligase [Paenibacillus sediminis]MBP1935800.1 pantoate--beta-alanine ligase [Paenibacillus sediminis]